MCGVWGDGGGVRGAAEPQRGVTLADVGLSLPEMVRGAGGWGLEGVREDVVCPLANLGPSDGEGSKGGVGG